MVVDRPGPRGEMIYCHHRDLTEKEEGIGKGTEGIALLMY